MPSKNNCQKKEEPTQVRIFKQLLGRSNKSLNIFEIQKELLQLKIMVRLMLSVEQYAAMQLCGSKLPVCPVKLRELDIEPSSNSIIKGGEEQIAIKSKKIIINEKDKYKSDPEIEIASIFNQNNDKVREQSDFIESCMSHLEKIDYIERDQNFFQKSIDTFINKSKSNSDMDQRILQCMINFDECIPVDSSDKA